MPEEKPPLALVALDVPVRGKISNYPEPFAARMAGRQKRQLGDLFGLTTFGVNLTRLAPGGISALMHRHSKEEELIYILEGAPTLVTEAGEMLLAPGMCAGFPAMGAAHHLVNRSDATVLYLEMGTRAPVDRDDPGTYPQDDLMAKVQPDGSWVWVHKDGRLY